MTMVLARLGLGSFLALLVMLIPALAHAARCTQDQDKLFITTRLRAPRKCVVQPQFQVCDDECRKAAEDLLTVSLDCETSGMNLQRVAKFALDECNGFRTNATSKYMPQASKGLEPCSLDQLNEWELAYGFGTAVNNCSINSSSCTEDCLKLFEDSVSHAALCAEKSDFSLGEMKKPALVRCLVQLKLDLSKNDVLHTVVHGDGSVTRANASVVMSPPPSSPNDSRSAVVSDTTVVAKIPLPLASNAVYATRTVSVTTAILLGALCGII